MIRSLMQVGEHPRRPSDLLAALQCQMTVLQQIDSVVNVDATGVFRSVMLQQTQLQDCHSNETITSNYSKWYLEVVLRRMSLGHILYSPHLSALIPNPECVHAFSPDQYTDARELRSLVQLLGPHGVKVMSERFIWHVASQVTELNKLVNEHRKDLLEARTSFDKPDKMKDLVLRLSLDSKDKKTHVPVTGPMESVLQRVTIIGEILSFRNLLLDSLHDVLLERLPFLLASVHNIYDTSADQEKMRLSEMCAAVGLVSDVDFALVSAMRRQKPTSLSADDHYTTSCLLLVFIALALPRLILSPSASSNVALHAFQNNAQCLPTAVASLVSALFCLHERCDAAERMKEFLALASSGILRASEEMNDPEVLKSFQPVYFIIEELVKRSPYLSFDLLESCFPYNLIRSAYQSCCRQDSAKVGV
ncbi:hypothetical protein AB6A40_004391 [Gnathostoma spinigerum]|uniref:Nck-associated protein 1 n=1 Tax=Gnathostoma spinigerum TaxID=75299 RepID=A0ABD6EEI6_9BILA